MAGSDYLEQAIAGTAPVQQIMAPLSPAAQARLAQTAQEKAREEAPILAAEAAKNKLAQEALAANPSELRALWPQVYAVASINKDNHLDLAEIDTALKNGSLSDNVQNALTVLKAGYQEYSEHTSMSPTYGAWLMQDPMGIGPDSLALANEAVNRNSKDDPYYTQALEFTPLAAVTFGIVSLATAGFNGFNTGKEKLAYAGVSAVAGALIFAGHVTVQKFDGVEDKELDQLKNELATVRQKF